MFPPSQSLCACATSPGSYGHSFTPCSPRNPAPLAPRPGRPPASPPLGRTEVVGRVPLAEPLREPRHLVAQHLVLAQEPVVLQGQLILCRAWGPLVILLWEKLLPVLPTLWQGSGICVHGGPREAWQPPARPPFPRIPPAPAHLTKAATYQHHQVGLLPPKVQGRRRENREKIARRKLLGGGPPKERKHVSAMLSLSEHVPKGDVNRGPCKRTPTSNKLGGSCVLLFFKLGEINLVVILTEQN